MPTPPLDVPRVLDAQFVAGAVRFEQLPPPQSVEIAFAGRSNVGKSSLMNALLGRRKLVRTSSTPGCTRQISLFQVKTRKGTELTWVDLPGYGYAKRSHTERDSWGELADRYLLERPALALVLVLVDLRRGIEEDDRALYELLAQPARVSRGPLQVLSVATKVDKVPSSARKPTFERLRQLAPGPLYPFSTELPETHVKLFDQILRRVGADQSQAGD